MVIFLFILGNKIGDEGIKQISKSLETGFKFARVTHFFSNE